jgi:hypothetical protein
MTSELTANKWPTTAARNGTAVGRLKGAGRWASPSIPLARYNKPVKIASKGVRSMN